jgi:transcription elongation factor GreA-like protein
MDSPSLSYSIPPSVTQMPKKRSTNFDCQHDNEEAYRDGNKNTQVEELCETVYEYDEKEADLYQPRYLQPFANSQYIYQLWDFTLLTDC